jgi:hypothetical protein
MDCQVSLFNSWAISIMMEGTVTAIPKDSQLGEGEIEGQRRQVTWSKVLERTSSDKEKCSTPTRRFRISETLRR